MVVIAKIIAFFASIWILIGNLWLPVWQRILQSPVDTVIIMGGIIVLFVLGIIFQAAGWKEHNIFDEVEKLSHLPGGFFWALMIMRVFYPLLTVYISMSLVRSTAFVKAFSDLTYSFYNYAEWFWYDQVIGGVVLLQVFVLSFLCIVRLKPLRLIRFWIHTIDFVLIGYILGNLYLLLQDLASGNLLIALIIGLSGIVLDVAVPFIFSVSALAPVYCFVLTLLSPILRFFGCFNVRLDFGDGKVYGGNVLLMFTDILLP